VFGFQVSGPAKRGMNLRLAPLAAGFQVWILALVLLAGCGKAPEKAGETSDLKPLSVYVVNYPLQYFAERIGGDLVDVTFPAPADGDPAFWSPRPEVITAYQQAGLILLNGAGYAKWVSKVSLPSSKLVDTSKTFGDRLIGIKEESTHTHGPEGKHVHGKLAFTTWLDLTLAIEQASAVRDAIAMKRPGDEKVLDARFAELEKELMEIDKQLKDLFSKDMKRPLVFSHPVYQYFERGYEINGMSVHWEPDEAPTEARWLELKQMRTRHKSKLMVWEGEPDSGVVKDLKALGIDSVVFDPCGTVPAEGDLLSVMRENVSALTSVYQAQSSGGD
jgi:zinc transport system substrate-binding protein